MRVRNGFVAAGVTIGSLGLMFATAGAASAATPTLPAVQGVITGPHTFTLASGETVVLAEKLHPNAPGYNVNVPVTGISVNAKTGVTTVTTGWTFLPLNRIGQQTTFTVVLPLP
ncbi:MAG TPA: hypothetical protein VKU77_05830 [Streptosporangiaceae bacterium]|nr:hypothetical protein [Streptosporangiaceae bacterium]